MLICGISIAAKAKTVQTEEVPTTRADQNVTGNTSQDREFIRFENEPYVLSLSLHDDIIIGVNDKIHDLTYHFSTYCL